MAPLITHLDEIKKLSEEREIENDAFRLFLKSSDSNSIDKLVHQLNAEIAPQIDCITCGNCCKSLMINVTKQEAEKLATVLEKPIEEIKLQYLEVSDSGKMVISAIPCHFLQGTKCSIYQHRFEGCREFPHLDREHFTNRLFGTLMNYGTCPIIFNVIESLKTKLGFKKA